MEEFDLNELDSFLKHQHRDDMERVIMNMIDYGRMLTKDKESAITSADILKPLLEQGMPISMVLQIQEAIDNPNAIITFKHD